MAFTNGDSKFMTFTVNQYKVINISCAR